MPLFVIAILLGGLGIALHERGISAARSVTSGDFFTGEGGDVAIGGNTPTSSLNLASSLPPFASLLPSLGMALPSIPVANQPAPAPQDALEPAPEAEKPVFQSTEPIPALCQVDARNHPGYTVICNGKQY